MLYLRQIQNHKNMAYSPFIRYPARKLSGDILIRWHKNGRSRERPDVRLLFRSVVAAPLSFSVRCGKCRCSITHGLDVLLRWPVPGRSALLPAGTGSLATANASPAMSFSYTRPMCIARRVVHSGRQDRARWSEILADVSVKHSRRVRSRRASQTIQDLSRDSRLTCLTGHCVYRVGQFNGATLYHLTVTRSLLDRLHDGCVCTVRWPAVLLKLKLIPRLWLYKECWIQGG